MSISAQDVKKLRDLTDAPMMECKAALVESGGDIDRAQEILREKGAAAAQKKADRSTSQGVARYVVSEDGKSAAGIVVECETDFVSGNADFKAMVDKMVSGFLAAGKAGDDVMVDGLSVRQHIDEAVGKIRENIVLKSATFQTAASGQFAAYNHHDGKWASLVEYTGDQTAATKVATQVVAYKPDFLAKEDVPADVIEKEIALETKRAMEEGKPENIAENIAKGRVNKEYFQQRVLLEQLIYLDNKTKVSDYLAANGGSKVTSFTLLRVGGE